MNRIEMATHISERVPFLEIQYKDGLKNAERLRKQFAIDYPATQIDHLTIDKYVIGKGKMSRSFCYRLEQELDSLGRIRGATANKFGVYYGKTKSDATMKYRFAQQWGRNKDEAFTAVKNSIGRLLHAASQNDMAAIRENHISPMFKGKLLFIYSPEKFAPIYAKPHLEHFLAQLNISGTFESEADMQQALMNYRNTWPSLRRHHACLYMRFLYDLFGYPSPVSAGNHTPPVTAPLLSDAIKGASFIDKMPPVSGMTTGNTGTGSANGDYAGQQKRLKQIGDRGEVIVLAMEKIRLTAANRKDLAAKINYIAERDDTVGYDILSFDEDGTERPIEVKATSTKTLERGFYLSANEVEQASNLPNYHIYFVFSAMSKCPQVLPVKQPLFNGENFVLKATSYHATLKAQGSMT